MCRVLIIGAGGVGTVVAHKVAKNKVFTDIMLASRTKSKCDEIAAAVGGNRIQTAQVDADHVEELTGLMRSFKPDIVINVALPYQDLTIMEACLKAGSFYLTSRPRLLWWQRRKESMPVSPMYMGLLRVCLILRCQVTIKPLCCRTVF